MKRLITLAALWAVANVASADVVTLKCDGKKPSGEAFTVKINFSPDQGWSKMDGLDVKMTGSVTADNINVFLLEMWIDRKTGAFTQGKGDAITKGTCVKNDTKF